MFRDKLVFVELLKCRFFYPELQENNITLMKEDVLIQLNDYFKKQKKKFLNRVCKNI